MASSMRLWLVVLLLVAACGSSGSDRCATPRTATPLDRAKTGVVFGSVRFEGTPPAMTPLQLGSEAACARQHDGPVLSGDALVHDGRVENAFVYIKDGLGDRVFEVPTEPVTLDQKGCLYHPHVVGVRACQPIDFVNSDAVLHNVHGAPSASASWNFSMGAQNSRRQQVIAKPEVAVAVRCDVHPWMRAWIGVVDHPYFAVTGPDGQFTLPDVPPGDYVVAAWHERFGTREAKVTVEPKVAAQVTFTFGGS